MDLTRDFKPDRDCNNVEKTLNFSRSVDKYKTIWQYLKRFQNFDFVKQKIISKYPSVSTRLANIKAKNISILIRQGESYFEASRESDLSVKPLILYYGMLNLVKALIIFSENRYTLGSTGFGKDSLESHGLNIRTKTQRDIAIRNDDNDLLNEFCYIQKSRSIFKLLHACWSNLDLSQDMKFTIKDMLLMHPSTWKMCTKYTSETPQLVLVEGGGFRTSNKYEHVVAFKSTIQSQLYNSLAGETLSQLLERIIPKLNNFYTKNSNNQFEYISNNVPLVLDEMVAEYKSVTGENYVLTEVDTGIRKITLHPLEIEFILMFVMGSLTRYIPQKWLRNINYEIGDQMFMLEAIINNSAISFPKMILEEIEEKDYIFTGDVSYWS